MCVLVFSTTFVCIISHSKENSAKYYHKCAYVFSWLTKVRIQTHTHNIQLLLFFHRSNGYENAPKRYVMHVARSVPVSANLSTTHDTTTAAPEITTTSAGTTATSPLTTSSQHLTEVTQLTTSQSTVAILSSTQTTAPTTCHVMGTSR